ncbi:hypothetical protein cand_033540 [Cryptosporidium andersoni]|uniref:Uncharacterized protein n=1 Tax=Cryptosporidium andersoni TaxID=117008 RepID=A0A1J4MVQ7_9CRYT|nr:hypothetical protein cand_033540 [Cryptosporidium andersoni]
MKGDISKETTNKNSVKNQKPHFEHCGNSVVYKLEDLKYEDFNNTLSTICSEGSYNENSSSIMNIQRINDKKELKSNKKNKKASKYRAYFQYMWSISDELPYMMIF